MNKTTRLAIVTLFGLLSLASAATAETVKQGTQMVGTLTFTLVNAQGGYYTVNGYYDLIEDVFVTPPPELYSVDGLRLRSVQDSRTSQITSDLTAEHIDDLYRADAAIGLRSEIRKSGATAKYNCHGNTFVNKQYWINGVFDVLAFINHGGFSSVNSFDLADIAVYIDAGSILIPNIVHSSAKLYEQAVTVPASCAGQVSSKATLTVQVHEGKFGASGIYAATNQLVDTAYRNTNVWYYSR